jgi:hypothetical protein
VANNVIDIRHHLSRQSAEIDGLRKDLDSVKTNGVKASTVEATKPGFKRVPHKFEVPVKCANCGETINKGDNMLWRKRQPRERTATVYCMKCAATSPRSAAAAKPKA